MNSECVWRHAVVNLEIEPITGQLSSKIFYLNKDGHAQEYAVKAGLRGSNYVSFTNATGSAKDDMTTAVQLVPNFGGQSTIYYSGFLFHQTYDRDHSISPVIMCRNNLHQETDLSNKGIFNDNVAEKLYTIWNDGFKVSIQNIFPRA